MGTLQDVRVAIRRLRLRPGLSLGAIITLAVGLAGTTIVFAMVNALLLHPLPYVEPDRLVTVAPGPTWETYETWRDGSRAVTQAGAYTVRAANVQIGHEVERVLIGRMTGSLLNVLGVRPVLGREFTADELRPGSGPVVLLTYDFWRRRFHASPGAVGRALTLDDVSYTIVGVLPRGFRTIDELTLGTERVFDRHPVLFVPITTQPHLREPTATDRAWYGLTVVGRLRPGATVFQAREEYASIGRPLAGLPNYTPVTLTTVTTRIRQPFMLPLAIASGAVIILLAVACANVTNLLLALAESRWREMATRAALGASAWRLVRASAVETALLVGPGGAAGACAAWAGLRLVRALAGPMLSGLERLTLDARVLLFATAVTALTGLMVSVLPALRLARTSVVENLGHAGAPWMGRLPLSGALVSAESTLALALAVSAMALSADFRRQAAVDLGFRSAGILTADVSLSARYSRRATIQFFSSLLERLKAMPEIHDAAVAKPLPASWSMMTFNGTIEGAHAEQLFDTRIVSAKFFSVLSIPVIAGRTYREEDERAGADPVLVVNDAFAQRHFGSGRLALEKGVTVGNTRYRVVGVSGDVRQVGAGTTATPPPEIYVLYTRIGNLPQAEIIVKGKRGSGASIAGLVRRAVQDIDPAQPLYRVVTLDEMVSAQRMRQRLLVTMMDLFAIVTLLLAAVGVAGITSYAVARRTREVAVRVALGATRAEVLSSVAVRSMVPVLTGVAISLPVTWALMSFYAAEVAGVAGIEWSSYAWPAVLVVGSGLAATLLPAWQVLRIEPSLALREE